MMQNGISALCQFANHCPTYSNRRLPFLHYLLSASIPLLLLTEWLAAHNSRRDKTTSLIQHIFQTLLMNGGGRAGRSRLSSFSAWRWRRARSVVGDGGTTPLRSCTQLFPADSHDEGCRAVPPMKPYPPSHHHGRTQIHANRRSKLGRHVCAHERLNNELER